MGERTCVETDTDRSGVVCVFTLSFMSLTGGFHCDDSLFCYIGSSLVLFIPVYMGGQFASLSVLTVVLTLAAASGIIVLFSAMHSKNRRLDQKENLCGQDRDTVPVRNCDGAGDCK